ncbi:estradiol 17-beta-dehydrogenase 8 [Ixodes scapularis]|uniref:estradiol 17-beta-dehydrogenase 8 n=1 Tax=Ixodes scapularis TaxID=6945 RepID=UPI001C38ACE3|nr:estradiol 17-beta-dehydrogenase 8 [Ixodes scapularis]
MSMSDRLALVTGGASGIGKCVCHALAMEGATVVVADINEDAATEVAVSLPGNVSHIASQVDVRYTESVAALFDSLLQQSLPLSIVVNSAGVFLPATGIVDTTDDDFDNVISVNLRGTFLVTRAAAQSMTAQGVSDGVIVNVSSILGLGGSRGWAAYAASKAGVIGLTKSVALELAPKGIRCNAVLPGPIDTPMTAPFPDAVKAEVTAAIPTGRMGRPEEIAEVIKSMCGPGFSFMTGAAVEVTGGYAL